MRWALPFRGFWPYDQSSVALRHLPQNGTAVLCVFEMSIRYIYIRSIHLLTGVPSVIRLFRTFYCFLHHSVFTSRCSYNMGVRSLLFAVFLFLLSTVTASLSCTPDSCLIDLSDEGNLVAAKSYCAHFTSVYSTRIAQPSPTYIRNCGHHAARVSSACGCLPTLDPTVAPALELRKKQTKRVTSDMRD
ncbi:hypothetical protein M501DRAFT_54123 [Patellaria atrata CBS 101060]|uniref:Uncharacterized protein n=1 Tax=Patellaria atrata CBS 101060 TaxID=1346257 RepID=A0A9P4SHJ1_9PEZI|nr:hypothetical protein M501DRAFT_54123 [Patellaria atrata CBS 101060]